MGFAEDGGGDVMGLQLQAGQRSLPTAMPPSRTDLPETAPRIDWAAAGVGKTAGTALADGFDAPGWLGDFVLNAGKTTGQTGPNAALRVTIPVVSTPG
jgi:hypothetical protein